MINPIKITLTTAGASTESFSLFSDADGYVTPFATGVTKAQLLAGYVSSVAPDLTTIIRVKSNTACMNSIDLNVPVIVNYLTLSTTSTSANWSPYPVVNTGITLTWDVAGDITPTSQNVDDPTFNLSANTGTVDMNVYDVGNLTQIWLTALGITNIDVSKATNLEWLILEANNLTTIDVSNNLALTHLTCQSNDLPSIDVSKNINLFYLVVYSNLFTPSATDQIYIDLANNSANNGTLYIKNNRTSASDTARATLVSRGWAFIESYTT